MTELSSVSGLRGVRERIEVLSWRVAHERWNKDHVTGEYRCFARQDDRTCIKCDLVEILDAFAALSLPPSPQPTNVEFQAGDEVWVRGEISEAIEDGDKDWVEAIFDSATGHIFVSMRPKDVRSSPAGAQGQVQGVQARVEAKIKQWRECPCGGPCAEFADSLAEVLK